MPQPSPSHPVQPLAPSPGDERRRRFPASKGAMAGGLAAIVLLAAGGIWFATRDGGDGGKDVPEARMLYTVPEPKVSSTEDLVSVAGMWTTDRNFVKSGFRKVVGYPLAGGPAQWEIPLSGEICRAWPHLTEDERTAIVFKGPGKDADCTRVGLLDLRAHKLLWQREVVAWDGHAQSFSGVTISGDTVAAGGEFQDGAAWTLDGRPLWRPNGDSDCQDVGYAGGDKLIAVTECGDGDNPPMHVRTLDPRTGEAKSTYQLPPGTGYAQVVSTDPLVVRTQPNGDPDGWRAAFLAIDDSAAQGKLRSRFRASSDEYESDCELTEGCQQIVVDPSTDRLFLATAQNYEETEDGTDNEVVAFSLKTGKPTDRIPDAPRDEFHLLGLDKDGALLAYQPFQLFGESGGVWRIDPRTHAVTQLLRSNSEIGKVELAFVLDGQYRYAAGRMYLGQTEITAPDPLISRELSLAAVFGKA
ncbi:hypothetical protein [Streptomyces palmae]|uniref:PQQ-binding-like beta-propeller repeat protein n=1 Tax=Streptomyces palmae TaxID=1701085 RepID=A0A4Z0HB88_9ACTN|nr:hypothetical protein [Streptomyces palmae]TGB07746.1 hypothetical protein E4099_16675 [Streptomyces palmae]